MNSPIGSDAKPALEQVRRYISYLAWAFTPLAIMVLALSAFHYRVDLYQLVATGNSWLLLSAALTWSAVHIALALGSFFTLRAIGVNVPFPAVLDVQTGRIPAKYLPGGVWQTVARAHDLGKRGVQRSELVVLIMIEHAIPFGCALLLGSLCLGYARGGSLPLAFLSAVGALVCVCAPLLASRMLRIKRPHPATRYAVVAGVYLAVWLVAGASFVIYWNALQETLPKDDHPLLLGTYLLSWAAGFLAVFAPQGIGVFEVVAGVLLQSPIPTTKLIVIVSGFRLISLVGDLAAYAFRAVTLLAVMRR